MFHKIKLRVLIAMILVVANSCNNGPGKNDSTPEYQKIEKSPENFSKHPNTPSNLNASQSPSNELHTVVVKEILTASRYLYLHVKEGEEQFWIAVRKTEIKIGGMYYYKRALLKTNFESKENNKVFEKIYLVTSLVPVNHGNEQGSLKDINISSAVDDINISDVKTVEKSENITQHKGSVMISELVSNPNKFEGQIIQISGKCVKVNAGIMNRNWIHVRDGSQDDYDLVITSDIFVPEGTNITMKALVSINKDFGAGYKYDLILENGVLVE
jgi:hypothetical protein